ncbi:MAG: hypothetical protein AB2693_21255 [Candidatus Thiodiazotropha sp.]
MKHQAIVSLKNINKESTVPSAANLLGTLRVKIQDGEASIWQTDNL